MIGVWYYKNYKITITINGNFVFKHEGKFYGTKTLDNAKLMIDALNTDITVNKYEIVAELTKIYTDFEYIKHILSSRFGFENIKLPKIETFEENVNSLIEKYESK